MSRKIWKYPLAGGEQNMFFAELPLGAEVLSADWEPGRFVVWAIVDPSEKGTVRDWFHIAGTDHEIPDAMERHVFMNRIDIHVGNGMQIQRYHAFRIGWAPTEGRS